MFEKAIDQTVLRMRYFILFDKNLSYGTHNSLEEKEEI